MRIFFFLILLSSISGFAQKTLNGNVYSARDSTALEAVSVYFDGTTLGTITNSSGAYSIPIQEGIKSSLVISMLGYAPVYVSNYLNTNGQIAPIYLTENTEELSTVHIENDDWSRKKKLNVFRKEFLGNSLQALECKILNEDDLKLHYSKSNKQLTAWSDVPLVIENKHLGYLVNYSLTDFQVNYEKSIETGFTYVHQVYTEGFTFFKELKKKTKKKFIVNRQKSYLGSTLHFLRSLTQEQLTENRFKIYYKSFEVAPYSRFKLQKENSSMHVELTVDKLSILYNNEEQSFIEAQAPFIIDAFGNHSPASALSTGGVMSLKRFAFMLPLDYKFRQE